MNISNENEKPINFGKPWTIEKINELIELAKLNELESITNLIGRSQSSVISQIIRAMHNKKII